MVDGLIDSACNAVRVVTGTFDRARAGAVSTFGIGPMEDLLERVDQRDGQVLRGK